MAIVLLKVYVIAVGVIVLIYAIRHFIFAYNRSFCTQRLYYSDIITSDMPSISVLIPMHNEEVVLCNVLDSLLECDYDRDRIEIIPINDHSSDGTKDLLEAYHKKYEFIRPIHRVEGERGKPAGLNDAMKVAGGDIIIVFDADYRPSKDMLRQIALAFQNPQAGAVMGRVIPYNTRTNILTRLLNIERSGGYQADQQARYNLQLIPQYGGTVGGFRKDILIETGGFNTKVLAEDTELTYRLYTKGWKVIYANTAECYEESPETWESRAHQIRRWSRGHNQVLFRYFFKVLKSPYMNLKEKIDGMLLLMVYCVPFLLGISQIACLILFFAGEMHILANWWVILFIGAYNGFGNFAPFYEIGGALMMDGIKQEVKLLPLLMFNFYFYMWHISLGFLDGVADSFTGRKVTWAKTKRFLYKGEQEDAKC